MKMKKEIDCKEAKGFGGQFPGRAMLAFHRKSYGLVDGVVEMRFNITDGKCRCFEVSRKHKEGVWQVLKKLFLGRGKNGQNVFIICSK